MRVLHPGLGGGGGRSLARVPSPTEDDIREALSGNLCRCREQKIVDAVRLAAEHT